MKYNKQKIMKRAHQIAKQMEGDYMARLAEGLRIAWQEAKQKSLRNKVIENWEKIRKEFSYQENFSKKSYFQAPKIWEKYGKSRLYIPRNAYEQAGYIDLLDGSIHPTRPGNYNTLENVLNFIKSL